MLRALITGCTGQDGSYLAEHLHKAGYEVWGLIRGQDNPRREWLEQLVPGIVLVPGDLIDQPSLHDAVATCRPDEVYNLAAISSPSLAWKQPVLTAEVTGLGVVRLLEAVGVVAPKARVVQASSIANHGPYGAAKLFGHTVAADYRERGLHVSCAVFGGHHSPRRGRSFFSRKVTAGAAAIAAGRADRLELGSLTRVQDWGNACDFAAQLPVVASLPPSDYVMSTGDPRSAQEWVAAAFGCVDLDWREHVKTDMSLGNVTDVPVLSAAPDRRLGWEPDRDFTGLVRWMVEADL
jgi:GDPmannose 4,6-dehydratase